eukprot:jgi/Chrzof1/9085/Cz03g35160.t1
MMLTASTTQMSASQTIRARHLNRITARPVAMIKPFSVPTSTTPARASVLARTGRNLGGPGDVKDPGNVKDLSPRTAGTGPYDPSKPSTLPSTLGGTFDPNVQSSVQSSLGGSGPGGNVGGGAGGSGGSGGRGGSGGKNLGLIYPTHVGCPGLVAGCVTWDIWSAV